MTDPRAPPQRPAEATASFDRVLAQSPDDAETHFHRGNTLMALGRHLDAIAHLAGAMAHRVWVLLPFNPDWRWLLDRDRCPRYPTARLFRQETPRNWRAVIARVAAKLDDPHKAKGPLARAFRQASQNPDR